MKERPLRTSVIGSYPAPGWLEFATRHLDEFGPADREELQRDAVLAALQDQLAAGLDVVTDGEQSRLDFNLSFYGHLTGIERMESPRLLGPPGHDQRDRFRIVSELGAPRGLGVVDEYVRLRALAPSGQALKASVPGPYTLAGRLQPRGKKYKNRLAVTEALIPIVRKELTRLVAAGCTEICVDEPSMSCYAYREDPARLVSIFNKTVAPVRKRCRVATHLCFGNYRGRVAAPRRYAPMFPDFLDLEADEIHVEMASREFAEIEIIKQIARKCDVAVGIIDVKSYYIESPEDVAERVRLCLRHAPPERLVLAPDCGLSQTARWAASRKLTAMVEGVGIVRRERGLS